MNTLKNMIFFLFVISSCNMRLIGIKSTIKNDHILDRIMNHSNSTDIESLPSDFPRFKVQGESLFKYDLFFSPHRLYLNLSSYIVLTNYKGQVKKFKKTKYPVDCTKINVNSQKSKRYTYLELIPDIEPLNESNRCKELVVLDENFNEIDRVRTIQTDIIPGNYSVNHEVLYIDDYHYYLSVYFYSKETNRNEFALEEILHGKVLWSVVSIDIPELKDLSFDETRNYLHFNSLALDVDGNIIVSYRHAGVFKLDKSSKTILWFIGRKRNDFKNLPDRYIPYLQHNVELYKQGGFSIWDNSGMKDHSRVLYFKLNESKMEVDHIEEYVYSDYPASPNMGSARILDFKRKIIDITYGGAYSPTRPAFVEFDFLNHRYIMNLTLLNGEQFFRVSRDLTEVE